MAVRTRTPSRGWSSVAPYSNYSNVVANYGAALINANREQKNNELRDKILKYKEGALNYSDLMSFLNTRLGEETPGSSMELDIRETINSVDDFERDKNIKITRARMMESFSKDGISAKEQRQIEEAILGYYKPGTTEYTTQISTIATAKEVERVEANNMKVAQLQSKLSEGGLNTREQVEVLKEMKKYSEPGSVERMEIESQIALKEADAKKEEKEKKMVERMSDLYDQYAEGGISVDEGLAINREMQKFVEKGSEEYLNLKQQEAELLENKASVAKGAAATALANEANRIKDIFNRQEDQMKALNDQLSSGVISVQDYITQKSDILAKLDFSSISSGAAAQLGEEGMGEIKDIRTKAEQEKAQYSEGQLVNVVGVGLVPLSELSKSAYASAEGSVYNTADDGAMGGNSQEGKIIQIFDANGQKRLVTYDSQTGSFNEVKQGKNDVENSDGAKEFFYKTGTSFTPQQLTTRVSPTIPTPQTTATEETIGKVSTQPKTSFKEVLEKPAAKAVTTAAKTAMNPIGSLPSTLKSISDATSKIVAPKMTQGKVPDTVDLGFTEWLNSITKNIPSLKSFQPTVGKINISTPLGKVNLPEYGVSEKISSLFGKVKTGVTDFVSNLFKKK